LEVIVAETLGFCFGVKIAVEKAEKAAREGSGKVQILGPIVHNPQQIKKLEEQGIVSINSIAEAEPGTVLIRAHGVPPETMKEIERRGDLQVIDATCPLVKVQQDYAKKLAAEGYRVIIIGEKDHPEAIGVKGHAGDALIVESVEDAESLPYSSTKLGVVVQTTMYPEKVEKIVAKLFHKTYELRVYNTICKPTKERQPAAQRVARMVDVMVVVGGKNSSNTKRLAEVCQESGAPTYHVEYPSELKEEWFKKNGKWVERVGLTAGASTPDFVIQEVYDALKKMSEVGGGEEQVIGAAAIFLRKGSILLEKRGMAASNYAGYYTFPGGMVRAGESPEDALKKRMRQELGVELKHVQLISKAEDKETRLGRSILINFFRVEWSGEPVAREKQVLEWVPLENVGGLNIPTVFKRNLEKIVGPLKTGGSA
jgi:(E)-4-hydroxy-3-methyl-but-2-enyl pyrophosphate reductase